MIAMLRWEPLYLPALAVALSVYLFVKGERGRYPFMARHVVAAPAAWAAAVALLAIVAVLAAARAAEAGPAGSAVAAWILALGPAGALLLYLQVSHRRGLRLAGAEERAAARVEEPPEKVAIDAYYFIWFGIVSFGLGLLVFAWVSHTEAGRGTIHVLTVGMLIGLFTIAEAGYFPFVAPQRFATRAIGIGFMVILAEATGLALVSPAPPGYPTDSPLWVLVPVAGFAIAFRRRGLRLGPT